MPELAAFDVVQNICGEKHWRPTLLPYTPGMTSGNPDVCVASSNSVMFLNVPYDVGGSGVAVGTAQVVATGFGADASGLPETTTQLPGGSFNATRRMPRFTAFASKIPVKLLVTEPISKIVLPSTARPPSF